MARNTSVSLGRHFEDFVKLQVDGGRYGTASEVLRAGLRMLEEEETKVAALRSALKAGERSGFAEDYTLEGLLSEVSRKRR